MWHICIMRLADILRNNKQEIKEWSNMMLLCKNDRYFNRSMLINTLKIKVDKYRLNAKFYA